jgi:hypothetical protein
MSSDQMEYAKIRERAEKRVKNRQEFVSHLIIFLMINGMLWFIYFSTHPGVFAWPLIITLGWGAGLVSHAMAVYRESNAGQVARERAIQREIEREIAMIGEDIDVKPKRSARLSDDGEIIYDDASTERRRSKSREN